MCRHLNYCLPVTMERGKWSFTGTQTGFLPITASWIRTAKLIKRARLLVVKDGPHCITWTPADEVNAELVNLFGKAAAQRAV
jgi:pimeloyl-ACP methyl ester carboxylesterase